MNTKETIRLVLDEIRDESFKADYEATDEEVMGVLLSHFFEWDGTAILSAAGYGLADSNFTDAKAELDEVLSREYRRSEAAIKAQESGAS